MAKQSSQQNKTSSKNMTKLIVPVKATPQGAYAFKEEMIVVDALKETLAKYKA